MIETFEIFNPLVRTKSLRNLFAQRFGLKAESEDLDETTIYAWGYPPASDRYPSGKGKRNPLDHLLRVMDLANPLFPAEVQMMALVVSAHAAKLAGEDGHEEPQSVENQILQSMHRMIDCLEIMKTGERMSETGKRQLAQNWLEFELSFSRSRARMKELLNGFYRNPEGDKS